mgnify:FL=1
MSERILRWFVDVECACDACGTKWKRSHDVVVGTPSAASYQPREMVLCGNCTLDHRRAHEAQTRSALERLVERTANLLSASQLHMGESDTWRTARDALDAAREALKP